MRRSLRWRMVLVAAVAIVTMLAGAGLGLAMLFERHVERVALAELQSRALTLAARVAQSRPDAPILADALIDPVYEQPYSGRYWQVTLGEQTLRSRSLWDAELQPAQSPPPPGQSQALTMQGPGGEALLVLDQALLLGQGEQPLPLRILVATDRQQLRQARERFLSDLWPYLALLGGLMLLASWAQITVGLRPLAQVGARVSDLGRGGRRRMGQDLPQEVVPLARQIDSLLDARDQQLTRARDRAANLAHGFKTPLQALLGDAAQLRDRGQTDMAESVEHTVAVMRRHVDRELARARLQTGPQAPSAPPHAVAQRLIAVLQRTPQGAAIDWQVVESSPGLRARIDAGDLTEALGALLENAMRHARSRVTVTVDAPDGRIRIAIADDGPGTAEADLQRLTRRGLSLDPQGDGQGLGLAMVADIVDAAQGELRLQNTHPGFRAELILHPAPQAIR